MLNVLKETRLALHVVLLTLSITFSLFPSPASSDETYKFKRMWPTLPQPWYFHFPEDIAVDGAGNVYVVDEDNDRIQKFTSDGAFITKWGNSGSEDGQFDHPVGIAVDGAGNVYVADKLNHRVQKFTSNGTFITEWAGAGDEQFLYPKRIAVDEAGNVYVVDGSSNPVQKFASDGAFITKWGSWGSGDGQFFWPRGIAVDGAGNVYVADSGNDRVQKFTSDGAFITKWGSLGSGDGQFENLGDIDIDGEGNVYVADRLNHRAQKFTTDGAFIAKWGGSGPEDAQFLYPGCIAVDGAGNVYVVDEDNDRVQKFTSDGEYITQWGSEGSGDGQFFLPGGIAVDEAANVYVVDEFNNRVQKFASDGEYIAQWGSEGSGDGQFFLPGDIAVDGAGDIYVTDSGNGRIQKFTSDGAFITKWGSPGSGDGQFYSPQGIAVGGAVNVYVVDTNNDRIQKFTSDGTFVIKWGSPGSGDGQFEKPLGIAVDGAGNVYVADEDNDRIQKFTSDGEYMSKFGGYGSEPGKLNEPRFLCVREDAENVLLLVTEKANNRVQVFESITQEDNSKAIIVAGTYDTPETPDDLWPKTQMCANFAYRALTFQGYTKETIYYLSTDTDLDLDDNGVLDDVDGEALKANLQNAITNWAADADNLTIYLADHGNIEAGEGKFRMSPGFDNVLSASELSSWLDTLQAVMTGRVLVVVDACHSGSFVDGLAPAPPGRERVVIASTLPEEVANFQTQGSISFSNIFWTHVFNGLDIHDSLNLASDAMIAYQTAQLDADGDGAANEPEDYDWAVDKYIGNGTYMYGDAPIIGSVPGDQLLDHTATATLYADNVTDDDGVAHVWAIIRPPNYNQGSSGAPVQGLISVDLVPVGGDRYEADYNGFNLEGDYLVSIYARDSYGHTSVPEFTRVSVVNPLRRRAIILASGVGEDDPQWPFIEKGVSLAWDALTSQCYSPEDVYMMLPRATHVGFDATSQLTNLDFAINTWAQTDTQDLVLYLIGEGDGATFTVKRTETQTELLDPGTLDGWLDALQAVIPGKVTVIYDACQSGGFLPYLTPQVDKERIVVASTDADESAYFMLGGELSFSKFFWARVADGATVYRAFDLGMLAVRRLSGDATNALLDDNGNGEGNDRNEFFLAENYVIGAGIIVAADPPLIGSISPPQNLSGGATAATVWVEDVSTTGTMDRVLAIITPPGYATPDPSEPVTDLPTMELMDMGGGRYEGAYSAFTEVGIYSIAVHAMDTEGNISLVKQTQVTHTGTGGVCSATPAEASVSGRNPQPGSDVFSFLALLLVTIGLLVLLRHAGIKS